jgi:hypothetical protein
MTNLSLSNPIELQDLNRQLLVGNSVEIVPVDTWSHPLKDKAYINIDAGDSCDYRSTHQYYYFFFKFSRGNSRKMSRQQHSLATNCQQVSRVRIQSRG